MKSKQGSKQVSGCDVCGEKFGRPASLGAHRWRKHGIRGQGRKATRPAKSKPVRGLGKKRTENTQPTFACSECGLKLLKGGMGSHLRFKHGIAGSSKWSIKAKKATKNGKKVRKQAFTTTAASDTTMTAFKVVVSGKKAGRPARHLGGTNQDAIRSILEKATAFRATAAEAQNKAERLFTMAAELKELI